MNIDDCNILIAEDHPISRKILFEQLKILDVKNITQVEDGENALKHLTKNKFDVFLLDLTAKF